VTLKARHLLAQGIENRDYLTHLVQDFDVERMIEYLRLDAESPYRVALWNSGWQSETWRQDRWRHG
jgi:hypothetical protein